VSTASAASGTTSDHLQASQAIEAPNSPVMNRSYWRTVSLVAVLLIGQTLASGVLFIIVATTTTPIASAVAFSALGFFVFGYTGVYYSCMATIVPADEMGGATAGATRAHHRGPDRPTCLWTLSQQLRLPRRLAVSRSRVRYSRVLLLGVVHAESPVDQSATAAE
jgi:ACS family hexuronate transporter-like MFS transporter